MKICSVCKIEKDESEFRKSKGYKNGINSKCKKCKNEEDRLYRLNNKDKCQQYNKQYYLDNKNKIKNNVKLYQENNKEYCLKFRKEYYQNNKEKIIIKNKEWRMNNPEKIKLNRISPEERRKKRKENIESARKKGREYVSKRKKLEPEYKLKATISHLFYYSITVNNLTKNKELMKYTGISYSDYINHFKINYPIEFDGLSEKGKYHIDHIIPVSAYDFTNGEEIKKCWMPENLRIITASENLLKRDKLDFELVEKYNIKHLLPERLLK